MTASAHPGRVVLIEDNPGDARLIEELLRERRDAGEPPIRIGHESSLAAGLDRLSDVEPDVVLLDLQLPDSSGLETWGDSSSTRRASR
jgi:HTH-type transcriptional regulator, bacterioopsin transcriptional activator and related proteins